MFNNKLEEHNVVKMIFTSFASLSLLFLLNQSMRIKSYKNNECNN